MRRVYCFTNRLASVYNDLWFSSHSGRHLLHDAPRVFVTGVLVGEDNLLAIFFCDFTHFWPFPAVTPASHVTEHTNFPPVGECFIERTKRISGVSVINHDKKVLPLFNFFSSPGDRVECREGSARFFKRHSQGLRSFYRGEGVHDAKAARQGELKTKAFVRE